MLSKKINISASYALLLFCIFLLGISCGNSWYIDTPDITSVSLKGEFCSEETSSVNVYVKIQMLVDISGSMEDTDPDFDDPDNPGETITMRQVGVREVINRYLQYDNISFSIISFNNEITNLTDGFTRDNNLLSDAIDALAVANDTTHTKHAINTARDVIEEDIASIEDTDLLSRTKYINLLFSDGVPYYNSDDNGVLFSDIADDVYEAADNLIQLKTNYQIGDIELYTALLGTPEQFDSNFTHDRYAEFHDGVNDGYQEVYDTAVSFMTTLAEDHGNASFTLFDEASDIDFVDIVSSSVTSAFIMHDVLVFNNNTKIARVETGAFSGIKFVPDSDGDGLADTEEPHVGTITTKRDTDGDKIGDGIEVIIGTDPSTYDHFCESEDKDSDGDGLYDCEEAIFGSNKYDPDSDNDDLPDGKEALNGMDPTDPDDVENDTDGDGLKDGDEIKYGLNPRLDESDLHEENKYKYSWTDNGVNEEGHHCFEITVSNIGIAETIKSDGKKAINKITVNILQTPIGDSNDDNLISVGFIEIDTDNPEELEGELSLPEIMINF